MGMKLLKKAPEADYLVTGCPLAASVLEEAARNLNIPLKVMEISEFLADSLK